MKHALEILELTDGKPHFWVESPGFNQRLINRVTEYSQASRLGKILLIYTDGPIPQNMNSKYHYLNYQLQNLDIYFQITRYPLQSLIGVNIDRDRAAIFQFHKVFLLAVY